MRFFKNFTTTALFLLFIAFGSVSESFGLIDNWSHWDMGQQAIQRKDFTRALNEFGYYLRHPEMHRHMFGVAYFGRALLYEKRGNYGQAVTEYRLAIQNDLHPTVKISDKAYMNLGTIYMRNKDYKSAIEAYSKAVENSPGNGFAHYYLGLAFLRDGQFDRAEKEAEEAKKLGITFTALLDELAKIKK